MFAGFSILDARYSRVESGENLRDKKGAQQGHSAKKIINCFYVWFNVLEFGCS